MQSDTETRNLLDDVGEDFDFDDDLDLQEAEGSINLAENHVQIGSDIFTYFVSKILCF